VFYSAAQSAEEDRPLQGQDVELYQLSPVSSIYGSGHHRMFLNVFK
jgi:hypothetical protein